MEPLRLNQDLDLLTLERDEIAVIDIDFDALAAGDKTPRAHRLNGESRKPD